MKIRFSPSSLLLFLVLLWQSPTVFLATFFSAAVHEIGHITAAVLLGVRLRAIEFDFLGARLYPEGLLPSYRAEAILAAAGPLFSLLLALFCVGHCGAFFEATLAATLSFAIFNLLPILDFDGGRVLFCLLSVLFSEAAARRVLAVSSYICLLLLFALSSCLLLRFGQSPVLGILAASLFVKTFLTQTGYS